MPTQAPALNALKHGLFAADHVLIKDEDPLRHQQFIEGIVAALLPVGFEEESIALRIASHHWRLGRVARYEASISNSAMDLADMVRSLDRLSLYETRLSRQLERERKGLEELQERRNSGEQKAWAELEAQTAPTPQPTSPTPAPVGGLKKRENGQKEPKSASEPPRPSYRAQLEEMERKLTEVMSR